MTLHGEVKFVHTYFVHTQWLKTIEQIMKSGNVQAVMDGELNGFMEAYLKLNAKNVSNNK